MPQKICTAAGANRARRNEKKAIAHGLVHVKGKFDDPSFRSPIPAVPRSRGRRPAESGSRVRARQPSKRRRV